MLHPGANLGIGIIAVGFVLACGCLPLLLGKIKRNRWYGFRSSKAFESEEDWIKLKVHDTLVFPHSHRGTDHPVDPA